MKMHKSTYSVYVKNWDLDQPLEVSGAKVTIFTSTGQLASASLPTPCDSDALMTGSEVSGDDASGCPFYDAPHDWHSENLDDGAPLWSQPEQNRKVSRYARLACIDNTGGSPVIHQCQRYFTNWAMNIVQEIEQCPPVVDRCDDYDWRDGSWWCSMSVYGGLYSCPGGLDSMQWCPYYQPCKWPYGLPPSEDENPLETMCGYPTVWWAN
jgi:hypothetical protein